MTNFFIGVEVSELCDQHLVGLHSELHQEHGTLQNHPHGQAVVRGHWKLGQVSTDQLEERHREVVEEMERRGMVHDSPLHYSDSTGYSVDLLGIPIRQVNRASLFSRCDNCIPEPSNNIKNRDTEGDLS